MGQVKFYQKTDLRKRSEMVEFLKNHFRYHTMNSWNNSTSYANNVKLHNVIPKEYLDVAYEMLETNDFYNSLDPILEQWGEENDYVYQAGFNGRSSGYIVMYNGFKKESEYKSYCVLCGQKNYEPVTDNDNKCGRCGENSRTNHKFYEIATWPGRSIDQGEDFEDWLMFELKERVKLVESFDKMCDDVVSAVIKLCKNCVIKEEKYTVTKTRKVLSCKK